MAERMHPLAALAARSPDCAAVRLTILPPGSRFIVREHSSPPEVCRATIDGDRTLLWLGPDEFLWLAPEGVACTDVLAVDVSHRTTAIGVSGPRAAWAISTSCALDLHPAAFPVGMCTRTVFSKAEIILWRTGTDTFHIDVARSLAPYVWSCLEEARREFLE